MAVIAVALASWLLYRRSRRPYRAAGQQSGPRDRPSTFELIRMKKRPDFSMSELPQPIPELATSGEPQVIHEIGT